MKNIERIALEVNMAIPISDKYDLRVYSVKFATKFLEQWLAQQEPVAYVYLHDIQQSRELGTCAPAYPISVGTAFDKSVPVFLAPPLPNVEQTPASYQYQDRNGQWKDFLDQRHYENTVADGSWTIRALYTAPPTAPEGYVLVPKVPTEAMYQAGRNAPCVAEDMEWREDYMAVWQAMVAAGEKK